jgi:AraC family transcriptional regulator
VTWHGTGAEIVQATKHDKIEFRFRGPRHLLAVYDQGMRSDGDTLVEGLPHRGCERYRVTAMERREALAAGF